MNERQFMDKFRAGKPITMREACEIADETARRIAARRAATNEIDGLKNRIHDLEIAMYECGCDGCSKRLAEAKAALETAVLAWFHIEEEP